MDTLCLLYRPGILSTQSVWKIIFDNAILPTLIDCGSLPFVYDKLLNGFFANGTGDTNAAFRQGLHWYSGYLGERLTVSQSVTCLATDASLTAVPGVVSSIPGLVTYFRGD